MRFSTASDFQFGPIGDVFAAGSAKFDEQTKKYTIKGSGADIWNNSDQFHFAWQPVEGDCEIIARVTSIQKLHEWTKVGVMIRADLTKDAAFGMMACGPDSKMQFTRRAEANQKADAPEKPTAPLPRWIKVQRQGAMLIGSHSADGQNWTELARQNFKGLQGTAYVGLAVCSHVAGQLSEAQFDNVSVTKK
jgi:hypothetical protein